jgi:hypothetical protein
MLDAMQRYPARIDLEPAGFTRSLLKLADPDRLVIHAVVR